MLKRLMGKNRKGFTLTELIVVVAILGILAAVSVPMVTGYLSDAKASADVTNCQTVEGAIKRIEAKGYSGTDKSHTIDVLAAGTDGPTIGTAVIEEMGPLPALSSSTLKYNFDKSTSTVTTTVVGVQLN